MARKVKCKVTGEYGLSDEFVKIDGAYYKSQEVYDAHKQRTQKRLELIDYVCKEFLNYEEGAPFSTFLPRKLQELKHYDDSLILHVFKEQADIIHQRFGVMTFSNELQKISYMLGIVRNALPEAKQKQLRQKRQREQKTHVENFEPLVVAENTTSKAKDLSRWLEDGDM